MGDIKQIMPSPADKPFLEVRQYLESRNIPLHIISHMEDEGILYQEKTGTQCLPLPRMIFSNSIPQKMGHMYAEKHP